MPSRATSATRASVTISLAAITAPSNWKSSSSARRPRRGARLYAASATCPNPRPARGDHPDCECTHAPRIPQQTPSTPTPRPAPLGSVMPARLLANVSQALATANRRGHRARAVGRNGDQVRRARRGVSVLVRICKAKIDRAVARHNRRCRASREPARHSRQGTRPPTPRSRFPKRLIARRGPASYHLAQHAARTIGRHLASVQIALKGNGVELDGCLARVGAVRHGDRRGGYAARIQRAVGIRNGGSPLLINQVDRAKPALHPQRGAITGAFALKCRRRREVRAASQHHRGRGSKLQRLTAGAAKRALRRHRELSLLKCNHTHGGRRRSDNEHGTPVRTIPSSRRAPRPSCPESRRRAAGMT